MSYNRKPEMPEQDNTDKQRERSEAANQLASNTDITRRQHKSPDQVEQEMQAIASNMSPELLKRVERQKNNKTEKEAIKAIKDSMSPELLQRVGTSDVRRERKAARKAIESIKDSDAAAQQKAREGLSRNKIWDSIKRKLNPTNNRESAVNMRKFTDSIDRSFDGPSGTP